MDDVRRAGRAVMLTAALLAAAAPRAAAQDADLALAVAREIERVAADRPLWPQGFDPLNVEHVDGGLLHTRFLRLGNETGELTAMDGADADIEALTEAGGAHPLFKGVARVTIAGIAERPTVDDDGERTIVLRAPGFTASFLDAEVEVRDGVVVVGLR